jgi:ribosomal protein S18 acetylase RimI-like enzyme
MSPPGKGVVGELIDGWKAEVEDDDPGLGAGGSGSACGTCLRTAPTPDPKPSRGVRRTVDLDTRRRARARRWRSGHSRTLRRQALAPSSCQQGRIFDGSSTIRFGMRDGEVNLEIPDASDLAAWIVRSRADYIDERVAAGDTLAEAIANADASMERTFPGGSPGPGQQVRRVMSAGEQIGWLWVGPVGSDPLRWWVWDIVIEEELRGSGYGRKAMLLAEELARAHGATSLGLNVFAHNAVARSLYASLGFEESSIQMRKALDQPPEEALSAPPQ